MSNIKKAFASVVVALSAIFLFACGGTNLKLTIKSMGDVVEVKAGQTLQLQTVANKANADLSKIKYEILQGEEFANVSNQGLLTVNITAEENAQISVASKLDDLISDTLTITVLKPDLQAVTITSSKTSILPGENAQLSFAFSPNREYEGLEWEILDGEEFATINAQNSLEVSQDAIIGEVIKVVAKVGELESNVLLISVGTPNLQKIDITSNKTTVLAGEYVIFSHTFTPQEAYTGLEWQIKQGAEFASFESNILNINQDATVGETVKVVAKLGDIISNEITITIETGLEMQRVLLLNADEITVYADYYLTGNNIVASVYNGKFVKVNDEVVFEIVSANGDDLLTIEKEDAQTASFIVKGNGEVTVRATVKDTNIYQEFVVNAIKAPEQLEVAEVFRERSSITYEVSQNQPLAFEVGIRGELVDDNLEFIFERLVDGEFVEGNFATYDSQAKAIVFKNDLVTGLEKATIKVTAKSTSTHPNKVSVSQIFNVNDGINIDTWELLKSTIENSANAGRYLNLVVLEKPGLDYDYDIVPKDILNQTETLEIQTKTKIFTANDLRINGNLHKINFSNMKEIYDQPDENALGHLLEVKSQTKVLNVEFKDLILEGNLPVDSLKNPYATYERAIVISGNGTANMPVNLTIDNIDISKFFVGLRVNRTLEGSYISDAKVHQIYSNGFEISASLLTLRNMTYGLCGGAGIEITPDDHKTAGLDKDQVQKISFEGKITSTNNNAGTTPYFLAYGAAIGVPITNVIQGIIVNLDDHQKGVVDSAVVNAEGEVNFVALVFNSSSEGLNTSIVDYTSAAGTNGIIDISQLNASNIYDYQYILLELPMGFGKTLVYNHEYGNRPA